jgi:hypothetical protein
VSVKYSSVCQLPQQEVADAEVAAGADEQVRRRQVGQRHACADGGFVDVGGASRPAATSSASARAAGDVLTAAVTGGTARSAGVAGGALFGGGHSRWHRRNRLRSPMKGRARRAVTGRRLRVERTRNSFIRR